MAIKFEIEIGFEVENELNYSLQVRSRYHMDDFAKAFPIKFHIAFQSV